jgi:hypothetical protein
MKLFFAIGFTCLFGCKAPESARALASPPHAQTGVPVSGPSGSYKVARIDSMQSIYLIYARRNDTLFKIVSDKQLQPRCTPIKAGQFYPLKLRSLLQTDLTPEEQSSSPLPALLDTHHMAGLDYDGKGLIVTLEGDSICDLYYARNLTGLCLQ